MECPKPLTNDEGEVRELTEQDLARFVPYPALPADLQQLLSGQKTIVPDANAASKQLPAA